jgi:hypothetical protein
MSADYDEFGNFIGQLPADDVDDDARGLEEDDDADDAAWDTAGVCKDFTTGDSVFVHKRSSKRG